MAQRWPTMLFGAALIAGSGGCEDGSAPKPERSPPPSETPIASSSVAAPASASPTGSPNEPPVKHQLVRRQAKAMGTTVTLAGYTNRRVDAPALRAAIDEAFAEIERLEGLMSHWRDESDVARINAQAGKGLVEVSPETLEVIEKSLWISRKSDGVFDITFASMGKLWRFDHDIDRTIPSPQAIAEARQRIGYEQLVVESSARKVGLTKAGRRINLGGIAKGYIMDRAAAMVRRAGVSSFFAKAGGDLYVEGRKPWGPAWTVGIRDPRGPEEDFFARLEVEDHAFSTAGDYERAFVKDGKRHHHIIDPRTGRPATASRSVTIWAEDALTADAIDDAVFILGPERGLELVASIPDCGAVIVDADNQVHISDRLRGRVQIVHPPSEGI